MGKQSVIERRELSNDELLEMVNGLPVTLTGAYSTPGVNENIALYQGVFTTETEDGPFEFDGTISLEWLPGPRLRLASKFPLTSAVTLKEFNATAEVLGTSWSASSDFDGKQEAQSNSIFPQGITFGSKHEVKSLKFHLPNFRDYNGLRTRGGFEAQEENDAQERGYNISFGRADFAFGGWRIVLDRVPNYGKLKEELRLTGGYAITHVGQITRDDDSLFTIDDGEKILEALSYFFSFCAARWSCPILVAGLDYGGNQVWTQWRVPKIGDWSDSVSWFSSPSSAVFNELLPGFLDLWNNPVWQTPLKVAINWYLQSISPATMDTGYVPPQIALEILAWVLFVKVKQTILEDRFTPTRASKLIEMLLSEAGISHAIPSQLADLASLVAAKKGSNGPEILTWLRNSTTHGNNLYRLLSVSPKARYEGWQLGIWYLELILLKLFRYNGRYFDRLGSNRMTGASEPVPWNVPPPVPTEVEPLEPDGQSKVSEQVA